MKNTVRPTQGWDPYGDIVVIDALGGIGDPDDRSGAVPDALPDSLLTVLRESGVTSVNLTVGTVGAGERLFERTSASIAAWMRVIDQAPATFSRVRTARDIRSAKTQGRVGVIFGFQDAAMLEGDLTRLGIFDDLGVRIVQLTYNRRNELGDGSLEELNGGLTDFGRDVVAEMDRRRLLVDLSHCGQQTTADGIEASARPVSITHSGCAALSGLPRNKQDQELRALAERGGVFGVYLMPFLRERGQPDAADVVRHIEHALDVCGEDHVGIGTDGAIAPVDLSPEYRRRVREEIAQRRAAGISAPGETDDIVPLIPDLNEARRLEKLADLLSAGGHSSARIEKILGGNFLRLFEEVWGA
jgi:membrane dipeptidase